MKWIRVEDRLPAYNEVVLAWSSGDKKGRRRGMYFAKYCFVRTWGGKKLKFVNMMSKGFWDDNVSHWCPLPDPPEDANGRA